jgi:FkbM family methyltransferase
MGFGYDRENNLWVGFTLRYRAMDLFMIKMLNFIFGHRLNKGNKLAALSRLIRWQIASRLLEGPIALPFVDNTFLFATQGMSGATGNWYCGLYEVAEMAFTLHFLREGDEFLDIGANIGSYTILAAGVSRANVISIEPIPDTMNHLKRNINLNSVADRVKCVCMGLSSQEGILNFSKNLDAMNHILEPDSSEIGLQVSVTTVDKLIGSNVPKLIKLDVEGHEYPVLKGAHRTLSDPKLLVLIIETNNSGIRYGYSNQDVITLMEGYGFKPVWYDPYNRKIIDQDLSQENTLFIRNQSEVEERIRSAKKFHLVNGLI